MSPQTSPCSAPPADRDAEMLDLARYAVGDVLSRRTDSAFAPGVVFLPGLRMPELPRAIRDEACSAASRMILWVVEEPAQAVERAHALGVTAMTRDDFLRAAPDLAKRPWILVVLEEAGTLAPETVSVSAGALRSTVVRVGGPSPTLRMLAAHIP